MAILFLLFFLGTGFLSGVPYPLGLSFLGVSVGFFAPFNRLRAPRPSSEHADQREMKDVQVFLLCSSRGILDSGWAKCSLLCDVGRDRSRTIRWKLHRRSVLLSCQGDVRSVTGARYHLCCLANNQPLSSLIGSSSQECAETSTNYPVPRVRRRYLTRQPLLFSVL